MKIEKIPYSREAFDRLRVAIGGYDETFREQVEQGIAYLWRVNDGESYAITRLEKDEKAGGPVLVICCYEGRDVGAFARQMIEAARALGFKGVRAHVSRPGMYRIGKRLGFIEQERVYFYGIE